MKIAVVSAGSDGSPPALAARELHLELRRLGHESRMLVLQGAEPSRWISAVEVEPATGVTARAAWEEARRRLVPNDHLQPGATRFSLPGPGYDLASHAFVRTADVVSLHDATGLVSPESVGGLLEAGKPVVWTLHDHRPFTGGCHHPRGCTRFELDCGECPQLAAPAGGLARRIAAHARECFDGRRVAVIASSVELAADARRSRTFGASRIHLAAPGREGALAHLRVFEELVRARPVGQAEAAEPAAAAPLRAVSGFLEWEPPQVEARGPRRPVIRTPDLLRPASADAAYRPSWSGREGFLDAEHETIWEATKDLPGWQEPADSQKLYEMAYHTGEVILEIGVYGGRSAVVQVKGALASGRGASPQFYGIDVDPGFVERSLPVLKKAGVAGSCLLYQGDLADFLGDLPIVPTMVFVDGDHRYPGVKADLDRLATWLAPGTPVLCHDYRNEPGVTRAVDEAVARGEYRAAGVFGCAALLVARGNPAAAPRGLPPKSFADTREALLRLYEWKSPPGDDGPRPTRQLAVQQAHAELAPRTGPSTSRAPWPRGAPPSPPLPATLPSGRPWPKFSIVTPSFNQGAYIEETILSVLNQGYPNVEHIIVDGGSCDGTAEVLERYRDRLAATLGGPDCGQSHAINKGFARATGDVLTWLNSDDMLAPGALAAAALALDRSGADMVAGLCQIYEDGLLVESHLTSCRDGPLPLEDLLDLDGKWLRGQFFYQPEVFFTRRIWERAGGYVDGSMHYSMDYDLWVRFAQANARLHVVGRPFARFRVHPEQKTYGHESYRPELREVCARHVAQRPEVERPTVTSTRPVRDRPLRVAMVNDLGFNFGAGIGHGRIARALAAAGHQVLALAVSPEPLDRQRRSARFGERLLRRLHKLDPDLVLVGNVHSAGIPPEAVERMAAAFPTVFMLHDAWLLTGRCAYTGSCELFLSEKGCDASCPTPNEYPELAPSAIPGAWRAKQRLLTATSQLALAVNSRWMLGQVGRVAEAARAAPEAPARQARLLHLGVPFEVFHPRDMTLCREALGLPQDRFIVLFSASSLSDPRKGAAHLMEALRRLRIPEVLPVAIGRATDETRRDFPGVVCTGYVDDERQLAMLYSAADVFVAPSLEESFGQVLVEASACGTPTVAYAVGGMPDATADGTSGLVVRPVAPQALAHAISRLHADPELRRNLREWGLRHVENEFSIERSYHHLYDSLAAALAGVGITLAPKISFPAKPPKLPKVEYLLTEIEETRHHGASRVSPFAFGTPLTLTGSDQAIERIVLRYYTERLSALRAEGVPWYLRPSAWFARMNRQAMRREVRRLAPSNGASSGWSSGSTHGASNGSTNGASNGSTNGGSNGANAASKTRSSGTTNGMAQGATRGAVNGPSAGASSGSAHEP